MRRGGVGTRRKEKTEVARPTKAPFQLLCKELYILDLSGLLHCTRTSKLTSLI